MEWGPRMIKLRLTQPHGLFELLNQTGQSQVTSQVLLQCGLHRALLFLSHTLPAPPSQCTVSTTPFKLLLVLQEAKTTHCMHQLPGLFPSARNFPLFVFLIQFPALRCRVLCALITIRGWVTIRLMVFIIVYRKKTLFIM